ncbi:MAG: outer membrane protein transport protein [Candidatus Magnetomorum sp.]|nr:outer membrane protein transport protein [Candidatus Magnetomorum sp.]
MYDSAACHVIKKILIVLSFTIIIIIDIGSTRTMDLPSSPNPVGSGARAIGMGGSFIGVADDATAASWNPGGLIHLKKKEYSIVGAIFQRVEDNTFDLTPDASGKQGVSGDNLNYLSFAYPFTALNCNMVFSLNYQHLYNFCREWDTSYSLFEEQLRYSNEIHYKNKGQLSAIGFAYAIKLHQHFFCGATLNLWKDNLNENGWEEKSNNTIITVRNDTSFHYEIIQKHKYNFSGINLNLGFIWRPTNKLTIGGVLKTPFKADLEHEERIAIIFNESEPEIETSADSQKINMPMSFGLGLAYRYSDHLTVSTDIYHTRWQNFYREDSHGERFSPITGEKYETSDIKPGWQVRTGMEYLHIAPEYVIPFRGGIFYDPAPAEGKLDKFWGFSLGSGIGFKQYFFDFAYQFRFGKNIGTSVLQDFGFSQNVYEHLFYMSMIYHYF